MQQRKNSKISQRMKEYESIPKNFLMRRTPVIIRLDGRSFSSFCKRFKKPYDEIFHEIMNKVTSHLCLKIQGSKLAQRHSDEISILLTDYDTINTDSFFEYNVQKICSVVAGMATAEFCRLLVAHQIRTRATIVEVLNKDNVIKWDEEWPTFDCRCFNIPENDISNYFYWRLLDAKRGSINMLAQSKFSHKELQGKNCDQMQEMLFQKFNINWGKLPAGQKVGFICYKVTKKKQIDKGPMYGQTVDRNVWEIFPSPAQKSDLDSIIELVTKVKKDI